VYMYDHENIETQHNKRLTLLYSKKKIERRRFERDKKSYSVQRCITYRERRQCVCVCVCVCDHENIETQHNKILTLLYSKKKIERRRFERDKKTIEVPSLYIYIKSRNHFKNNLKN
jgi:hypothetical protein